MQIFWKVEGEEENILEEKVACECVHNLVAKWSLCDYVMSYRGSTLIANL